MRETTGERQTDMTKLKQMTTAIMRAMLSAMALTENATTGMKQKKTAQIGSPMIIYGILLPNFDFVPSLFLPKNG